jgi:leucyl aminopeptidase (aminopeptidase T)
MHDSEKDEIIATLKADYVKIFGTLTDQIGALQEELNELQSHTRLVNDLNIALADKKRIQDLAQLKEMKSHNEMI